MIIEIVRRIREGWGESRQVLPPREPHFLTEEEELRTQAEIAQRRITIDKRTGADKLEKDV